jgi:hypothetical protein
MQTCSAWQRVSTPFPSGIREWRDQTGNVRRVGRHVETCAWPCGFRIIWSDI